MRLIINKFKQCFQNKYIYNKILLMVIYGLIVITILKKILPKYKSL